MRDGLGWVADALEFLARVVRKGDERLEYWIGYAGRLEHELGEAVHRARCPDCQKVVGAAGIEPAASAMSKNESQGTARKNKVSKGKPLP